MICASSGSPVSIKVCCSQSSPKLRTNLRGSTGQHCSTYTITHCQQLQSLLTSSPSRTFTTFSRMKPMFESILTAARITLACPRSAGPCEEPMTNAAEAEQPTLRCPNAYHHPCPLAVAHHPHHHDTSPGSFLGQRPLPETLEGGHEGCPCCPTQQGCYWHRVLLNPCRGRLPEPQAPGHRHSTPTNTHSAHLKQHTITQHTLTRMSTDRPAKHCPNPNAVSLLIAGLCRVFLKSADGTTMHNQGLCPMTDTHTCTLTTGAWS